MDYISGILSGLEYLENKGYVHRDIKPENIMLSEVEGAKVVSVQFRICDFGLSARSNAVNPLYRRCGTPGYVAPEIVVADAESPNFTVSTKGDVFSAGVIMYLLISNLSMIQLDKPLLNQNH